MDWTSLATALIWWSAVHFVGDFAFQSAWMAIKKCPTNFDPKTDDSGPNEILIYHCLTYAATFVVMARLTDMEVHPVVFFVIFLAHYVVDWLKARKRIVKTIWLDQTLHLLTLALLILLGWM